MTTTIILHQWEISPFCQKVARSLRYKGLSFEAVNYNGVLGAKVGRLSKVGKVPVLDINGRRLQDSTRIVRYLDECHPEPPLYPAEPSLRALAELWEDWSDELLYWFEVYFRVKDPSALEQAVQHSCAGRPALERLPIRLGLKVGLSLQLFNQGLGRMAREDVEAEFVRHLDRIEVALAATGWLVGNRLSIADISVASQLLEVQRTSVPMGAVLQERPHIQAWFKNIQTLD
ncbi:MAG: glutathione S-transferase family protein [Moraxellaceae bacterium]|nr:glutathione S-transferase family protein [Moraxellaceae bacterium]